MRNERGFTLIEILVSMAIFAMIVIGAMGVLGATDQGGFLEGFPTGFVTARVAKDYTAASVYLQALQEFVAGKGSTAATVGSYCIDPPGTSGCSPDAPFPAGWSSLYPTPPGESYQLDWSKLEVLVEHWYWYDPTPLSPASGDEKYCLVGSAGCASTTPNTEFVTRVRSTLTWQLRGQSRSVTMERFIP